MATHPRPNATPSERSLFELRKKNWTAIEVVGIEKYKKGRAPRKLFGFIEILAYHSARKLTLAVVDGGDSPFRTRDKILACGQAASWLQAGNKIEVHGWKKVPCERQDGSPSLNRKYEQTVLDVTM